MAVRSRAAAIVAATAVAAAAAAAGGAATISTYAGGFGEGVGTNVAQQPSALAVAGSTLYVADRAYGVVRALDTTSFRETVVASGFREPTALAVDGDGNLFVGDATGVREIARSGRETRVAGLGAVAALAVDGAGDLYASDQAENRVVRVAPSGAPATVASVRTPTGLDVAPDGSVVVVASADERVVRVDRTGTVSVVAGGGAADGEGGPATGARLAFSQPASGCDRYGNCATPYFYGGAVALAGDGSLLIAEGLGSRILRVDPTGTIRTLADLSVPRSLTAVAVVGSDVWFATGTRVGRVTRPGRVDYYAGDGDVSGGGDGGPAVDAQLRPTALAVDGAGTLYALDGRRVRKIDGTGTITTIPIDGAFAPVALTATADGTLYAANASSVVAVAATGRARVVVKGLRDLTAVAADGRGDLYVISGGSVRKVDRSGRVSVALAATAARGRAGFVDPNALAVDAAGNVYVAANFAVWKLDRGGRLVRVAGRPGDAGSSGDGGPAAKARVIATGLAVDAAGDVYVADEGAARVRTIDRSGRIHTVAGDGRSGFGGDGGPATAARLDLPVAVATDRRGRLYIADTGAIGSPLPGRIRRVAPVGS